MGMYKEVVNLFSRLGDELGVRSVRIKINRGCDFVVPLTVVILGSL